MIGKIDFKRSLGCYGARRGQFRIVEVPDLQYLMIDGHGDPNTSPSYAAALQALYPVAYSVKFASKTGLGRDYVVPPLEGLWWADDPASFTTRRDKSQWHWTLLLMTPEWIDDVMVETALTRVAAKDRPARLDDLRLQSLSERTCVQTLHVGDFDDEGATLARMHDEFIPDAGYRLAGTHHEIYLSDVRRVAPEKRRTILRQPVTPTARP